MTADDTLEKAALHMWFFDFNPVREELALLRRQLDDALAEIRRLTTATAMPRDAAASAAADIVDLMVDAFLRGLPMAGVRSRVEARLRAELATMRGHAGPDPDVAAADEQAFPDPTPGMLGDPRFDAIWRAIRTWDIGVPGAYAGHAGAMGNHVRAILDALASVSTPDLAAAAKIFGLAIAGAEGDDDQQTIRAIARVLAGLERSGRQSDGGSEASP